MSAYKDYRLAKSILGNDFFSPEEIARVTHLKYSNEILIRLRESLPIETDLKMCRENEMLLIPGPSHPLSPREALYQGVGRDHNGMFERCSWECCGERVEPGWIAINKKPLARSYRKTWEEQKRIAVPPKVVPNAAEIIWCISLYFKLQHGILKHRVRTAENHMTLGPLENSKYGWGYGITSDDNYEKDLGILEALRFSLVSP